MAQAMHFTQQDGELAMEREARLALLKGDEECEFFLNPTSFEPGDRELFTLQRRYESGRVQVWCGRKSGWQDAYFARGLKNHATH